MLPNLVSVGLERAIRQNMDAYNVLNTANISKMLLYCEKNSQSSIKKCNDKPNYLYEYCSEFRANPLLNVLCDITWKATTVEMTNDIKMAPQFIATELKMHMRSQVSKGLCRCSKARVPQATKFYLRATCLTFYFYEVCYFWAPKIS